MNLQQKITLVVCLFVSLFLVNIGANTALATDDFCLGITGQNVTVPAGEGPDLNEGVFDFDAVFAEAQKGCAEASFATGPTDYELEGWVWDTNLGWTSLAARGDAAPYQSGGVDVGDFYFRSFIKGTSLRGWWWNDALGWISLNCLDLGVCGTSNYGGIVAANGALTGYAWSDSLGWINLAGIQLPSIADLQIEPEVNFTLLPFNTSRGFYSSINQPVYARTDDTVYRLAIGFNYNGQSLIDDFDFDFSFNWRDQLMAQQVREIENPVPGQEAFEVLLPAADRGNADSSLIENKIAVSKRFAGGNKVSGFTENGANNYIKAGVNGQRMYVARNNLLANVPSTYFGEGAFSSLLEIETVDIAVKDPDSGEVTVFTTPFELNRPVIFNPPVSTSIAQRDQVTGLSFRLGENDPIDVVWEEEDDLDVGAIDAHLVLFEPPSSTSDYIFCLLAEGTGREGCMESEVPEEEITGYAAISSTVASFPGELDILVRSKVLDEGGQLSGFELSENTGLYGYVSYTDNAQNINYITGNLLTSNFQVFDALITGTTRVDAFRSLTGDQQTLPSLKIKSEKNRESFLKFSQALLRGKRLNQNFGGNCNGSSDVILDRCEVLGTANGIEAYSVQTSANSPVAPVTFNLDLFEVDNTVFAIVVGRDLIIDQNVFFTNDQGIIEKDKKLVIMVFKNGNGLGGNIYVKNDVTLVQANIFADGSLFSVGEGWTYNAGQLPFRDTVDRTSLKNQFLLFGNLVSQNTIGGCDLNPPRLGNGTISVLPTFQAREEACLYDLNYFRYSPYVPLENGTLNWPDDTNRYKLAADFIREPGQTLAQAREAMKDGLERSVDVPGDYSLMNMFYSAPPRIEGLPSLPTGFTFSN